MRRSIITALTGLACVAASGPATAATLSGRIQLEVPVVCKLAFRANVVAQGRGYALGQLHEFCNAPNGFAVQVRYPPNSLRGAVMNVDGQSVVLDGSGQAEVLRSPQAKIMTMNLSATPAASGFDAAELAFDIVPL